MSRNATTAAVTTPAPSTKGVASKPPAELKREIDALVARLKTTIDAGEKKKIRRALRLRGHRGGLKNVASLTPAAKGGKGNRKGAKNAA